MKIAILTSEFMPFNGGIAAYARELAFAATASGHDVVVLAPDYGEDTRQLDRGLPFRVTRYRDGPATMRGLPRRIRSALQLLRRERFDIIHAADWPFFIAARLARLAGIRARYILTLHGTEVTYMRHPKRKLMLDALGFWERKWALWISNSQFTHGLLLKTFPRIDPNFARPIPLGVSESWIAGRIDRAAARQRHGVAETDFVIMSLGRIVPRKGHLVLAEALSQVSVPSGTVMKWWIVGPILDEAHAGLVRAAAQGRDFETTFFDALETKDVQIRLSASDLFCLPGYQDEDGRVEGFGLVFLEAAAYGVPSIATRSGGIPDVIEDGVTGLLVPERDPAAVAAAVTTVLNDPALRLDLARAAAAKAAAATWAGVARSTYEPAEETAC